MTSIFFVRSTSFWILSLQNRIQFMYFVVIAFVVVPVSQYTQQTNTFTPLFFSTQMILIVVFSPLCSFLFFDFFFQCLYFFLLFLHSSFFKKIASSLIESSLTLLFFETLLIRCWSYSCLLHRNMLRMYFLMLVVVMSK